MKGYDDGKVEVSRLHESATFDLTDLDKAVDQAVSWNKDNVYLVCALLSPDGCTGKNGRSTDADFYATSVIWCDIDRDAKPEELKFLYDHCPPNVAVITARTPHRRVQFCWKLEEPLDDPDLLRQALAGVQQYFTGDPAVKNPTSLMRAAGTVNWPTEKKRAAGRVNEPTEYHELHYKPISIEAFLQAYPASADYHEEKINIEREYARQYKDGAAGLLLEPEKLINGREGYMSEMVFGAIMNLTADNGCWPTHQEVFDDAWPSYERGVAAREGRSLDQDGRGKAEMARKVKSKLRAFSEGRIRGCETLEKTIETQRARRAKQSADRPQSEDQGQKKEESSQKSNENKDQKKESTLKYIKFKDIESSLEANDFVQGLFGENQFSVTYGESNCGKTFFMTDLSFHIAMGKQWRDRRVEAGGVIYAALEGARGLRNRIAAFKSRNMITADIPFAMVSSQIDFLNPNGNIQEFIDLIKRAADDLGSVKLVVVDTLARALMGGDENSGQDMGMIVRHADALRYATGAHANFIHHSGKDLAKGARGHSSLRAAVDTEIEVTKDDGADYSIVKVVKQREMEAGKDMAFKLDKVSIGVNKYNEEITSCVVEEMNLDDAIAGNSKTRELTPGQKFVYDVISNQLAVCGEQRYPYHDGPLFNCITYENLKFGLEEAGVKRFLDSENGKTTSEDKVKSFTQTRREQLKRAGKIGFNRHYIWIIESA